MVVYNNNNYYLYYFKVIDSPNLYVIAMLIPQFWLVVSAEQ